MKRCCTLLVLILPAAIVFGQVTKSLELTQEDGLHGSKILCELIDGDTLVVSTNDGLYKYSEGAFSRLDVQPPIDADIIRMVATGAEYVLASRNSLYVARLQGTSLSVLSTLSLEALLGHAIEIKDVANTAAAIVVGTTAGLASLVLENGHLGSFGILQPSAKVRAVLGDAGHAFVLFSQAESSNSYLECMDVESGAVIWRRELPGFFLGLSRVGDTILTASNRAVVRIGAGGDPMMVGSFSTHTDLSQTSAWLLFADEQNAYIGGEFPNVLVLGKDGGLRTLSLAGENLAIVANSLFLFADRTWIGTTNGLYFRLSSVREYGPTAAESVGAEQSYERRVLPSANVSGQVLVGDRLLVLTDRGSSWLRFGSDLAQDVEGTSGLGGHSPVVVGNQVLFASGRRIYSIDSDNRQPVRMEAEFPADVNTLGYDDQHRTLYVALRASGMAAYDVQLSPESRIRLTLKGRYEARPTSGTAEGTLIGNNINQFLSTPAGLQVASDSGYHFYAASVTPSEDAQSLTWAAGTDLPVGVNQAILLKSGLLMLGTTKGLKIARVVDGKIREVPIGSTVFSSIGQEIGKSEVRVLRAAASNLAIAVDGIGLLLCDPEFGTYTKLFAQDVFAKVEVNDIVIQGAFLALATQGLGEIVIGIDQKPPAIMVSHDNVVIASEVDSARAESTTAAYEVSIAITKTDSLRSQLQLLLSDGRQSRILTDRTVTLSAFHTSNVYDIYAYDGFLTRSHVELTISNRAEPTTRRLLITIVAPTALAVVAGLLALVLLARRNAKMNELTLGSIDRNEMVFSVGEPIHPEEREKFVDRLEEARLCREYLDTFRVVNIFGQRRIGKNSLYNIVIDDMRRVTPSVEVVPVAIFLQASSPTLRSVLEAIVLAVASLVPEQVRGRMDVSALYQTLQRLLRSDRLRETRVVLLFNDLPPLPSRSGIATILKYFGDNATLRDVRVMLLSKVKYHERAARFDESKKYIGDKFVALGPFNLHMTTLFMDQYRRLLTKSHPSRRLRFGDDFLENLHAKTAGIPYLLHLVGYFIMKEWSAKDTPRLRKATTARRAFGGLFRKSNMMPTAADVDRIVRSREFCAQVREEYIGPQFGTLPKPLLDLILDPPPKAEGIELGTKRYLEDLGLIRVDDDDNLVQLYPLELVRSLTRPATRRSKATT